MEGVIPSLACFLLLRGQTDSPLKPYSLPIGISISLPTKPQVKPTPGMEVYVSRAKEGVVVVGFKKLSGKPDQGPADQQLAGAVVGTLDSMHGKLLKYGDVLLDGWSGLEIEAKDELMDSTIRTFVVGDQILSVTVAYPISQKEPSFTKAVLDSVKLADGAKAGPFTATELPFKPLTVEGVRFSVEFPGEPKDTPNHLGTEEQGVTLHQFHYQRDLREFSFSYATIPDEAGVTDAESQKKLREYIANDILNALHPQSQIMKTVTRDGREWTKCFVRFADFASGRLDVVFADSRIYALLSGGPDPWAKSAAFNRFFDSFKLTN